MSDIDKEAEDGYETDFCKYVSRQEITKFLIKYEIFKKILHVDGSIIECGVRNGGGLMALAQFSAIFEPVNYTRQIIGFDTFEGFPELSKNDKLDSAVIKKGINVPSSNDLEDCIKNYDSNRFLGKFPKIQLVKGDATETIPEYIEKNPHLVVSLLYLDMILYEPTKVALENFVPRMPKGAIIVFDELNSNECVGETKALLDTIGIKNLRIQRFPFNSFKSYAILE